MSTAADSSPAIVEAVHAALASVDDPEIHRPITELGMVADVTVDEDGRARVTVLLTVSGCPLRDTITSDVTAAVSAVTGVSSVEVALDVMTDEQRTALRERLRGPSKQIPFAMPGSLTRVYAIASGKGGVGKSSVTANLATAIAARGFRVGVLDADIWGFSIPRLLGIGNRMEAERVDGSDKPKIIPNRKTVGAGELEVVSTGFLVDESTALMWRGLMLTKAVEQFLADVAWGDLDYLLIDMPPGTGDVQMGLARLLPRTSMLIVTTPALAAQRVAQRAADMAARSFLPVVGVVENMSAFVCDHGESYPLFGEGGGDALAAAIGTPLVGQVPLEPSVAAGNDAGAPVSLDGQGPAAAAFRDIAARLVDEIAPPETAGAEGIDMAGCSARMLDAVAAAFDAADRADTTS